jgi:2,4'-dihydroxyacetophenone dioxygenase
MTEFWREIKPIENVFRPGALPDLHVSDGPIDDDRYYIPLSETAGSRPLFISNSQNRWCDVLMARGAGLVNRHYHPHQVFAFTISGRWATWSTTGSPQPATSSTSPPARATPSSPTRPTSPPASHSTSPAPLIWLDENGDPDGTFDVFDYIELCRERTTRRSVSAPGSPTSSSDRPEHRLAPGCAHPHRPVVRRTLPE